MAQKFFRQSKPRQLEAEPARAESALFDSRFYLELYPDIAEAGVDPFGHYMSIGWTEGRQPSALFNLDWYARQYPETGERRVNPLSHYLQVGGPEGSSPTPLFEAGAYAAFRGEAPSADFLPLVEFLKAPPEPGFNPCPLFDTEWFLRNCPEMTREGENYLLYFARSGARSGFDPSARFSCLWYLTQYADVAASLWNPLEHYLAVGQFDGRRPLPGAYRPSLVPTGAHEEYGEYTSRHTGEATVIEDAPREGLVWNGRLAVHLHIFYEDRIELLGAYLKNLPAPFSLFISVPDSDLAGRARHYFRNAFPALFLIVQVVPNRGRDLAPLLVDFAEELREFDLLVHVHSKKSVHTDEKRDWSVQMLHHLFRSRDHTDQVLGLFVDEPGLGMVFPVYHPAVRDEIQWGGNRPRAMDLLGRLGVNVVPNVCPPFPAGSFFVARASVFRSLWAMKLKHADFDEEKGQPDATLAHVIERVLGLIPGHEGLTTRQVRSAEPHSLSRAWREGRQYSSALLQGVASGARGSIPASAVSAARGLKIVVYSCATGGYDVPLPIEHAVAGAEYVFFSDRDHGPNGLWRVMPLRLSSADPVRQARLHKTSPHLLFPEADIAVWIDGNIAVTGNISVYIDRVLEAGAAFGLVRHPVRQSFVDEAFALSRLSIEQDHVLSEQTDRYSDEGAPEDLGLTETNFMVADLRRNETRRTLDLWRDEIMQYSARDQVSFDYARWKAGAGSIWLFDDCRSVRSNLRFAYFDHGGAGHAQKGVFKGSSYTAEVADRFHDRSLSEARRRAGSRSVDVIITVHNAAEDVRSCLASVNLYRDPLTRLILIDDGSDPAAARLLRDHISAHSGDILIRHEQARGYTFAANAGLNVSTADVVVLLNSDTIVTKGAIRNLVAALERDDTAGLAGPLSNAATWQSVPEQIDANGDYVVNKLPLGISPDDLADICDSIPGDPHIRVPALNGFCLAIRRDVIRETGLLDQDAFPAGYGEETDYCFRAAEGGFCAVIAVDSYVFHSKSKSFGHERRKLLSQTGFNVLLGRYGREKLEMALWMLESTARLRAVRNLFRVTVDEA